MKIRNQEREYLTEKSLGVFLKQLYPKHQFINNKVVPKSGLKNRPDFRNEKLKLIVEFDGYRHYSFAKSILIDREKDKTYSQLGYKIVRIPYFVQLSTGIIKLLFDKKLKIGQNYPHGFIDRKAMLPADFCELGIERFKKDLIFFSIIKDDIKLSLENKIKELGNKDLVLPRSLYL